MPGNVVETTEHYVLALVASESKTGLQIASRDFKLDFAQLMLTIIALEQGYQLRRTLPFVRALVFQQDHTGATLDHAQANGGVIEHNPVELFAFRQGLVSPLGRFDDLLAIPAIDAPANQYKQQKKANGSRQGPFGIAKKILIANCIQADPGRVSTRTQLEAQAFAGNAQAQR